MKLKTSFLLICTLMLSAPLVQAQVTIGGDLLAPGGYTTDKDGNLVSTGQASVSGQSSVSNDVAKNIFASLCASPFMKKYAAVCQ